MTEIGEEVTLEKDVPEPEEWYQTGKAGYYFQKRGGGKRIHEEAYYAMVRERNVLAEYIEEVEPVDEKIPEEFK